MTSHPKIIRARRNRRPLTIALVLLLAAAVYTGCWWLHGRFWVVTDNAFVTGNLIPVEADATDIVTEVLTEETRHVNKGDLLARLGEHRAQATLGSARGNWVGR